MNVHKALNLIILGLIPIIAILSIITGINHDYIDNIIRWRELCPPDLSYCKNPFDTSKVGEQSQYGPLFLIFYLPYRINQFLPKILFGIVWLFTAFKINEICKNRNISNRLTLFYVGFILFNPYYWYSQVYVGFFDVIIGITILMSVLKTQQNKEIHAGIMGATGFLIKFMTIPVFLPLFFGEKRIKWKLILSTTLVIGSVYLIVFVIWGNMVFLPIIEGSSRTSKMFSIFRFIRGIELKNQTNFDYLSPIITIIGLFVIFFFCKHHQYNLSTSALLSVLTFWLLYAVGSVQMIAWFIPLTIYWCIDHEHLLLPYVLEYLGAFSYLAILYFNQRSSLTNEAYISVYSLFGSMRGTLGLINFILTAIFMIEIIRKHNSRTLKRIEADPIDKKLFFFVLGLLEVYTIIEYIIAIGDSFVVFILLGVLVINGIAFKFMPIGSLDPWPSGINKIKCLLSEPGLKFTGQVIGVSLLLIGWLSLGMYKEITSAHEFSGIKHLILRLLRNGDELPVFQGWPLIGTKSMFLGGVLLIWSSWNYLFSRSRKFI